MKTSCSSEILLTFLHITRVGYAFQRSIQHAQVQCLIPQLSGVVNTVYMPALVVGTNSCDVACRWASYTRYAFQATAQVELEGQQLVCTATSSGVQAENCPTGDTLLGDLHFVLDLKQNSFVLLGFFVGLHVLGAAVVRWRHW